jgi:hypothetical protein
VGSVLLDVGRGGGWRVGGGGLGGGGGGGGKGSKWGMREV